MANSSPIRAEGEFGLLGGRLVLSAEPGGLRPGHDALLLAAAAAAESPARALELGSGTGAAALALAVLSPGTPVTGLERDDVLADAARANAARNALDARVRILTGDVAAPPPAFAPGTFELAFFNPPFNDPARGQPAREPRDDAARREGAAGLQVWFDTAWRATGGNGVIVLICRADRLDTLLALPRGRRCGLCVLPLLPGGGRPAHRVLMRVDKAARAPLVLHGGLVLHEGPEPSADAARLLRGEAVLDLRAGVLRAAA